MGRLAVAKVRYGVPAQPASRGVSVRALPNHCPPATAQRPYFPSSSRGRSQRPGANAVEGGRTLAAPSPQVGDLGADHRRARRHRDRPAQRHHTQMGEVPERDEHARPRQRDADQQSGLGHQEHPRHDQQQRRGELAEQVRHELPACGTRTSSPGAGSTRPARWSAPRRRPTAAACGRPWPRRAVRRADRSRS